MVVTQRPEKEGVSAWEASVRPMDPCSKSIDLWSLPRQQKPQGRSQGGKLDPLSRAACGGLGGRPFRSEQANKSLVSAALDTGPGQPLIRVCLPHEPWSSSERPQQTLPTTPAHPTQGRPGHTARAPDSHICLISLLGMTPQITARGRGLGTQLPLAQRLCRSVGRGPVLVTP